ncbi:UBP-type zinc finger domain-containing protein [Streptomyces sp. NPDC059917]|uniref:UBP-type zinc finger domain-containing protein n=1 Tax=Streptomyces sp. NPDC059917 TaxID=3347002 RepID=UPI003652DE9A
MGQDTAWSVAPDGGRPQGRTCSHTVTPTPTPTPTPGTALGEGCADCLARGWTWVRLRRCLTCGHIGCCDSSRGRHAYSHYLATGHPVAASMAPDEDWAWCFPDEVFLIRE